MKKYTNRIKLMPKFTKCMSLAMILTFTGYEEAFAEMSYAEQTSFTVSMENQTLKSVINWVEKNSQFIFIYRTDIDLSRRVNVDVRNKTIEAITRCAGHAARFMFGAFQYYLHTVSFCFLCHFSLSL